MGYMDRQYIEEHGVIERYLHGKLTHDEQQAFEEAYLADPELLEQLELAERLQQGLIDVARTGRQGGPQPKAWLASFASPPFAAAASIVLVVSLVFSGMLYRENSALRNLANSSPGMTRLQPLIAVRGSTSNTISTPADGELIVLLVDPGAGNFDAFRARISRMDPPELVAEFDGLEPGYEDNLALAVPGSRLGPGDYEVLVEGTSESGTYRETNRVRLTVVGSQR
jgi:hypothetical protein